MPNIWARKWFTEMKEVPVPRKCRVSATHREACVRYYRKKYNMVNCFWIQHLGFCHQLKIFKTSYVL